MMLSTRDSTGERRVNLALAWTSVWQVRHKAMALSSSSFPP
jgi:hypothetical protein